jgi:hypothetical protein
MNKPHSLTDADDILAEIRKRTDIKDQNLLALTLAGVPVEKIRNAVLLFESVFSVHDLNVMRHEFFEVYFCYEKCLATIDVCDKYINGQIKKLETIHNRIEHISKQNLGGTGQLTGQPRIDDVQTSLKKVLAHTEKAISWKTKDENWVEELCATVPNLKDFVLEAISK